VDSFRDDYKGHMIFCHESGPEYGPWIGVYSVWGQDGNSGAYCVLNGSSTSSYSAKALACEGAEQEAKKRIDALLGVPARLGDTLSPRP